MDTNTLYRFINPPMIALLRSPLHAVMSANTMVLQFKGRKSGQQYTTPVSYSASDGLLHAFAGKSSVWWKSVAANPVVRLTVRGQTHRYAARVTVDNDTAIIPVFTEFLRAVPRDAKFAGVNLLEGGIPDPLDIARVAPQMVHVCFTRSGE